MPFGGSKCGLESGKGMAGVEHGQLWIQRGEFPNNLKGEAMIQFWGIRSPKQHARRASHGSGAMSDA